MYSFSYLQPVCCSMFTSNCCFLQVSQEAGQVVWYSHLFHYFLQFVVIHTVKGFAAAAAKSLQLCPTLCDPRDGSPPGSPVPGFLQARTLEWVAISFSNAWKWKVKVKSLSRSQLLATPWTAAYQAPLSMDFPGKNTGVGCHCLGIVNKAEIDVFLELSCLFDDPVDVGNLAVVPLPFLKSPWTSGSSRFTYCWSLAWRILNITLLACEMSAILR